MSDDFYINENGFMPKKNVKISLKKGTKEKKATTAKRDKKESLETRKKRIEEEIRREEAKHNSVHLDENAQFRYEYEIRKKVMIMWSGVVFFMIIIGGFWIYNTKKVFQEININASEKSLSLDGWDDITKDFSEKMTEIKEELDEIKTYAEKNATSTSAIATTTVIKVLGELSEEIDIATSSFPDSGSTTPEATK